MSNQTYQIDVLGAYILWDGQLAKIVGTTEYRTAIIEFVEEQRCPHCDGNLGKKQFNSIISSPQFQKTAKPIKTLKEIE